MSNTDRGLGPLARKLPTEYRVLLMLARSALQGSPEALLCHVRRLKDKGARDRAWRGVAELMSMDVPSLPLAALAYSAGKDPARRHLRKVFWPVLGKALDMVPGPGLLKDVAFTDGTMLFHDPIQHLRRTPKLVRDALALAPGPLVAGLLVGGAFFRGTGVKEFERSLTEESEAQRPSPLKQLGGRVVKALGLRPTQ